MTGRDFLATADRLARMGNESDWRSAVSRCYYGVYLECRDAMKRWGFAIPHRGSHGEVGQRLSRPGNADLNAIGLFFQRLSGLRNRADYDLASHPDFSSPVLARSWVMKARDAVALLDAIDADPARRAQAIADIRAAFP